MHKLYELKEKLMRELEDYSENGKFSKDDVEAIKYVASAIDHLCNIMEDDEGYSERMMPYSGEQRGSYRGSYAGRRNARRDSMGRYSGERGYSRNALADKMRELMDEAPDERTREEMRRMVEKLENA